MTPHEHAREAFVLLDGTQEHDVAILTAMILSERTACATIARKPLACATIARKPLAPTAYATAYGEAIARLILRDVAGA